MKEIECPECGETDTFEPVGTVDHPENKSGELELTIFSCNCGKRFTAWCDLNY